MNLRALVIVMNRLTKHKLKKMVFNNYHLVIKTSVYHTIIMTIYNFKP